MANLKNQESTQANLESIARFTSFAKKIFNDHVSQVYSSDDATSKLAREALLITDKDNVPLITAKQITFFLSLQKLEQQVSEHFLINSALATQDKKGITYGEIKLNPSLKYKKDGTPVGTRQIKVPHIDESKLSQLNGFTLIHGKVIVLYSFPSKKQIKILAYTEAEGIRAMEHILKIVEKDKIVGVPAKHCYIGKVPDSTPNGDLHGITSRGTALHVSSWHGDLYTIFLKTK